LRVASRVGAASPFETRPSGAPQDEGISRTPHGEEAHSAVSNHEEAAEPSSRSMFRLHFLTLIKRADALCKALAKQLFLVLCAGPALPIAAILDRDLQ
jgi:hypothetical protein